MLTRDDWSRYIGERVDRLTAIHAAALERLNTIIPFPEQRALELIREGSAQDVIAAVRGEYLPGIHFNSDLPRLARICADVDAALSVRRAA